MTKLKKVLSVFLIGMLICTNVTFVAAEENITNNNSTQDEVTEEKQKIRIDQSSIIEEDKYSFSLKDLNASYSWTGQAIQPNVTLWQEKINQETGQKETKKLDKSDYSVQYKNNYRVGTATVIVTGKGNYEGSLSKNYKIVKNDTKISVSNIQLTSAKITFNAIKGAQKYDVQLKDTSGKVVKTITTKQTNVTFSSLAWNRKYSVQVKAYAVDENQKSYNYTIAITSFTTKKASSKLTVSNVQPTSAKITFNAVSGAQKYDVQLKNTSGKVVKTITTKQTNVTFSSLAWNRKYSVQVKAYGTDESKKSYNAVVGTTSFTTKKASSKLTVSNVQPTSAKITFNAVSGAQKYDVQLKNTSGKVVKTITTKQTNVTFSSLAWNRKYSVQVKAYGTDESKKSYNALVGTTSFTTKKASSKLTVSNVQPTSAKITFNAVSGAQKYDVQLKNTSGKVVKTITTKQTNVTFSSLAWNRKYSVQMKAYGTDESKKSYSVVVGTTSFTTKKATTKITVSNVKTTSATIKLTAVKGANKYVIQLKNSSGKVVKTITTTKTSINVSKLSAGNKYTIQVKAYGQDELKKSYNAVVGTSSLTTLPTVAKVTLSSVKGGNEMAQVNWKTVSGASGYEIYRSTNAKSGFKKVKTVSNQTKSYTNYLLGVKKYYYKVRAYKKVNGKTVYGAFSTVKSCQTKKPTNKTYYLRVNTRTNVTTVYAKNFSGKYVAVKSLTTSCGVNGYTQNILGTHYTQAKYRWKYMHEDCYTQYATRITGHYLFHSIPYSKPQPNTMWYNSYNKLGNFASAGCVRLRVVDSKWIYDHCPLKTKTVVVYSKTDPLKKEKIARINTKSKNRGWDPTDPDPKNPWKK